MGISKFNGTPQIAIHIMENPTITNAWTDVFPISSDETNKTYKFLMLSFLAVAIKTLLSRFNKKKKKAHHIEVFITKPTQTQQREVTPTPLPSPPPVPEPLQQPPPAQPLPLPQPLPAQPLPLPQTPPCPKSPPDTSKTCKICHKENTQQWWIQCDKRDQWMHPNFIGMLVKDFKVL